MCDQKTLCLDIETTGLLWTSDILSVGVSYRNGDGSIHSNAWNVAARNLFYESQTVPQVRARLVPLVQQADLIIGHNLTFDLSYLFKLGLLDPEHVKGKLFDTLLMARMTAPHESVSLDNLCAEYQIGTMGWRAKKANRANLSKVDVESLLKYNKEDTLYNLLLGEHLWDLGKTLYDPAFMKRESEFCRVMAEIRVRGMGLNPHKVYDRVKEIHRQKQPVFQKYLWDQKIDGPNDRNGLLAWLDKHGLSTFVYTPKGGDSVNEDALHGLVQHLVEKYDPEFDVAGDVIEEPLYYDSRLSRVRRKLDQSTRHIVDTLDAVLACRGWDKEINTWLLPLVETHGEEDGRAHALYTVAGTVSYRLNCSEPGLQAIPDLDIWEPHWVLDYSQAEFRLGALYAHFDELAELYAKGHDAHTITAMRIFKTDKPTKNQRKRGKTVNFASNYGAGPVRLAGQLGIPVEEAREFLHLYKENLWPLFEMSTKVTKKWEDTGYIKLWTGKRRWATRDEQKRHSYKAWNQLVQGGVAELAKEAMMALDARGIPMLAQVHDSIKFPPGIDIEEVRDIMVNALPEQIRRWTNPPIQMLVDHDMKGV